MRKTKSPVNRLKSFWFLINNIYCGVRSELKDEAVRCDSLLLAAVTFVLQVIMLYWEKMKQ